MKWSGLRRSFRQQIVVLTAGVTAVAMLLLTLVVQIVLSYVTTKDLNRVLEDRADAVVGSATSGPSGEVTVPASPLDAGIAVYDDQGTLVAGNVPDGLAEFYLGLSTTDVPTVRNAGVQARVQARPFVTTHGASGVVIVAERRKPYEEAERLALIVSLVTGTLTTLAAAGIAAWATRRALRPVAEMAETATEWSEHDLARRFALGPPDNEISALAATLDQLLDKVSAAIRSEQRLTSEMAHELRTPLTTIQGMADLVLLRDVLPPEARGDVEEISAASQRMAVTITALLDLARNEATVLAASRSSLETVIAEVVEAVDAGDIAVMVDVADALLELPDALAVRAISPVVENAVQFASSQVAISSRFRGRSSIEIIVDDDGPGLDASRVEVIFSPGTTSSTGTGSGLGLAIARRIARTVGGDVTVELDAPATRFVVRLPRG